MAQFARTFPLRSVSSVALRQSTERDFIYVTTQHLNHELLQKLSEEVGESRTLLVMCSAFRGKADHFQNLTIKKIPKAVLARCEWGHDDYSLQIENLLKAPRKPRTFLFEELEAEA
jgi:adenine-specific DNA-methyltransferase